MFVGHYAVSLALKGRQKKISLGLLFIAVQLVDLLFFPFVLLGIEHFNLVENYTESTHFQLSYMPYTHSLLASFLWAALAYIVVYIMRKQRENTREIALLTAIAVLSHWFLDLLVHTPDLPLIADSGLKLGFGLWNNAIATYVTEAILLLIALLYYLKSTEARSALGKYGMIGFVILLLLINIVNIFGPFDPAATQLAVAITAIISYLVFALIAHWLDKKRS
ncbi:MAG: hypothetical protein KDD94_00070 [Calditrichaeota bacterium]|nr:hypothetical protein [Calditrichota bacterium]